MWCTAFVVSEKNKIQEDAKEVHTCLLYLLNLDTFLYVV